MPSRAALALSGLPDYDDGLEDIDGLDLNELEEVAREATGQEFFHLHAEPAVDIAEELQKDPMEAVRMMEMKSVGVADKVILRSEYEIVYPKVFSTVTTEASTQ